MKKEENLKWEKTRASRIEYLVSRMLLRHKKERETHYKRMKSEIDKKNIERDRKIEKMSRNFENTERQAETIKNIEIAQIKRGGSLNDKKSYDSVGSLQSSLSNKQ